MTEQNEKNYLEIIKGITEVADILELSKEERVPLYNKVLERFNIPSSFLDVALGENNIKGKHLDDIEILLHQFYYNCNSDDLFGFVTRMIIKGYLKIDSQDDKGRIHFALTEKGEQYGEKSDNIFPVFYQETFHELLTKVDNEE